MKRKTGKEFKFGKMALSTKDFGLKIWQQEKVDSIMQMEISMKE